ncbi:MAG: alpha/beta hydrolase fold domain-containing protein [Novosphingobium sp.]|nr:alpha/beta hydrolase fold domain-containing protein [Novosphingobium sp.]
MAYQIDKDGTVDLGGRTLPVPGGVSKEAQAFLATPPWGDTPPPPADGPIPMWVLRPHVDEQMKLLNGMAQQFYPVDLEPMEIGGVPCMMVRPKEIPEENKGKVLMNLHGGGFVLGGGSLIEAIPIAATAKVPVIAVDYRLAPEHPYPAAVDDAVAVYKTMLDYHTPDQIGIYGSSAGGFLTGQTIVRLQREGLPLPACCGVFTAGGDLTDLGDTAQIFTLMGFWGEGILPVDHEVSEIRAYVGGADANDPGVSPIQGDLSDFPPTLLVSGTRDAVLSATASFHRALRRAGVDADLFVYEAMPHAHWYMVHLPEAREAIDVMSAFFLKYLKGKQA